jgi:hypothetical protein
MATDKEGFRESPKDSAHSAPAGPGHGHAPASTSAHGNPPGGPVRASLPSNHHAAVALDPQKVIPKEGASAYKVRTKGAESFRRAGITFTPESVTVDGASLTDEQRVELLNTPHLVVEEVGGSAPAKKTEK